jgi:hypothetical protein
MRTQAYLDRLAHELSHNCGDWLSAAKSCGLSLMFVRQWVKDDPIAASTLTEAEAVGVQGLYSAAVKRAVEGYEEDVYYKGDVCGQKTVYSDSLLTTLLKGKLEAFKAADQQTPQVTVNIANLMPRASSYDEWLAMKNETLKPQMIAAPVMSEVIEGQITQAREEVSEIAQAAYFFMKPPFDGVDL